MRLHVVLPAGFEERPSGGNRYDARVCAGLAAAGWDLRITALDGPWLPPGADAVRELARTLDAVPNGATVLVDGLIASPSAAVLVPRAARLRLAVLLHMPLATAYAHGVDDAARRSEREVLAAAAVVVVTSGWTRDRLAALGIGADRIVVATPGVDPVPRLPRDPDPVTPRLLCVAAVAPHKGQDVLIEALAAVRDRPWTCALVGPLDHDPGFVRDLRGSIDERGLGDRVEVAGPLARPDLGRAYARADVLLHPARSETYGMALTEALAHGLPVIASRVGGIPEALGRAPDGSLPGRLVRADDPAAWARPLRRWLDDGQHRRRLAAAASSRATTLPTWDDTTEAIAAALGTWRDRATVGSRADR